MPQVTLAQTSRVTIAPAGNVVTLNASKNLITIGMGGAPGVKGDAGATGSGGNATVTSRAASYTEAATTGTNISLCDATAGAIVAALPTAVGSTAIFTIKKKDATANAVVVTPSGGQKIDGATTASLAYQFESITFASDGTNWHII